jgi:hypothetical protein
MFCSMQCLNREGFERLFFGLEVGSPSHSIPWTAQCHVLVVHCLSPLVIDLYCLAKLMKRIAASLMSIDWKNHQGSRTRLPAYRLGQCDKAAGSAAGPLVQGLLHF